MEKSDQKKVQDTLRDIAADDDNSRELAFDPRTGQIMVVEPNQHMPSPDAVVASEIADDGFFSTYK